jgi:carbon storage regulator CsrA
MLVLTRKMEQKIQIGQAITVTVLRVKGGAVRIGIEAPPGVRILRAELSPGPELPKDDSFPCCDVGCLGDATATAAGAPESQAPRSGRNSEPAGDGDDPAPSETPSFFQAGPKSCGPRHTAAPAQPGGHRRRPLVRLVQKEDPRRTAASRAIGLGTVV